VDASTYSYNVRSWTTGITATNFTENLYYNDNTASLPSFTPTYNGNISGMQWNVPSESLGYNRAYTFSYDGLNRLTDANYCGFNGSAVAGTTGMYNEHMGFDKMGNFSALTRYESGSLLNNLSFTYTGNQLKKVDNAVSPYIPYGSEAFNDKQKIDTEYLYDQNGSTTADVNTGISTIQYNLLNLPDQIQFIQGHKNLYTYDATGKKLEAINYTVRDIVNVPIGTISTLPTSSSDYTKLTTDYVGNMIYENGSLKEILLPDGYWQNGVYYYYLKDHLGDNRVVINSSGAVIEKSHYYPSGMRFYPESTSNSAALPFRYNGKELEAMNGLNQMDYGARRRYSWGPILPTPDPLRENYYSISPYAYCLGNPVKYIDPTGMWTETGSSYNTSNPDEISEFLNNQKRKSEENNSVKRQKQETVDYLKTLENSYTGLYNQVQKWAAAVFDIFAQKEETTTPSGEKTINYKARNLAPDYMSVDLSGNAYIPLLPALGGGFDLSLGYVRNDGLFLLGGTRTGIGYDFSISGGFSIGSYSGMAPLSATSLSGKGLHLSAGVGPMSYSLLRDISNNYGVTGFGSNWNINSISVGIGLTPANISITQSNSFNPYYLYKK